MLKWRQTKGDHRDQAIAMMIKVMLIKSGFPNRKGQISETFFDINRLSLSSSVFTFKVFV